MNGKKGRIPTLLPEARGGPPNGLLYINIGYDSYMYVRSLRFQMQMVYLLSPDYLINRIT